jgi:hypothetical protein
MTARTVVLTDTLETFRTTFNSLSQTDIGDPATLTTTATSVVGAVNELAASVTATGFTLRDETSSTQTILSGNTLNVVGSSGIIALVSATDTLTISVDDIIAESVSHKYNADGSNTYTNFSITVAAKDSTHIYNGTGSGNGYKVNTVFSPFLKFKVGNTYRFDQSDSSNSGHPLLFYYDAGKTTQFSTGVTTNGTPGSSGAYTEIAVTESTPNILYYQCSVHGYMGSRVDVESSNIIAPTFTDATGITINFATQGFSIAQAVALG